MVEINENINIKSFGKHKKKKQIILTHTTRKIEDYIHSLKNRYNGNYDKIPNYIVSREGLIYKALPNIGYSNIFKNSNINKNSIIISLENLGWLEKRPLKDYYVNWIHDIYKGDIVERKWRDYFFWQPYTDIQLKKTAELCVELMNEFSIDKKCIGHNVKINDAESFEGIVSKSNYDSKHTGLSPAFNFELFLKYIENEQLV